MEGPIPGIVYGAGASHGVVSPPDNPMSESEYIGGLAAWHASQEGIKSAAAYRAEDIPLAIIPEIIGASPTPGPGYNWPIGAPIGRSGEGIYDPSGIPGGSSATDETAGPGLGAAGLIVGIVAGLFGLALLFGKK